MNTIEIILLLEQQGISIAEISRLTGETLSDVCEVIYENNNTDKHGYNGVF